MTGNPYESPDSAGKSAGQGKLIRWIVQAAVILGVVALLAALFLPAVRTAREPARRMSCSNNLKQIALALPDTDERWILGLGSMAEEPHPGGVQAAFVDGSVHFLSAGTKKTVLRALITIAGDDDAVAQETD